ncbi:hypothetical protein GCM10011414_17100 [Croceivirga lutea]|uniref:VOC family protein n=1 Tax=Croceivirga lutea TaxID=1775167 RepID=UPI0016398867|nr:VOC family protein [Croceivirga lutea]GGG47947.1 hypothetical protein GCM10011414_17100 [Croceivirga lutea]
MDYTINGIQQIGIGVSNANAVFNYYRKNFGFDILVFEDEAEANLMTKYTNGRVEKRKALLTMNLIGGGGLEIWQFLNRQPVGPKSEFKIGDLGINMMKLRSKTGISQEFITDKFGNWIQLVQDDYCFCDTKTSSNGGVMGAIIGVSDIEKAIRFYKEILGFNITILDETGHIESFKNLPGGQSKFRRVLLKHNKRAVGGFGKLLGPCQIELVQNLSCQPNSIFKDRLWGDLGYIHLCFDVMGIEILKNKAGEMGFNFKVDSAESFDMGEAAGRFAYIEDPDGTLIELVETHKVPVSKKLGLFINLKNRNAKKPLPNWMVKTLKFSRVTKDL